MQGLDGLSPGLESIKMAFKYAQEAIALDDTLDYAHTLVGAIYLIQHKHEKAIAEMERADYPQSQWRSRPYYVGRGCKLFW